MHKGLRNLILFVILVIVYILFMASNSFLMIHIERPFEKAWRERMKQLKNHYETLECVKVEEFEELIQEIEFGQRHGFSALDDVEKETSWTFGSSYLFSVSVATTVGYGHLAPGTQKGQIVTAIMTSLSVPLNLLLTTVMVIRLLKFTRKLRLYMERQLGDRLGLLATRLAHLSFVTVCVLSFFVILVAIVFQQTEPSWNIFEALYFSIISVSTVGLGDYVPGEDMHGSNKAVYLIFCSAFLVFGVVFALLVLETLYEIPELGVHVYLLPTDDDKCDTAVELSKSSSTSSKSHKDKLISNGDKISTYGTDQ